MAEFFTAEQIASLSAGTVYVSFLVKFDFTSGPAYAWMGNTPLLALDGNTYYPTYGLGNIDGLGHSASGQSTSVTLSLDGLPGGELDFLSAALADTGEVNQQLLTVYLQLFTSDWQPSGMPIALFRGFMQPPSVSRTAGTQFDAGTQSVRISAENIFFGRSRPPHGRYTDRDQQARSDGDKFFGFVSSLLFKKIVYPDY